MTGEVLSGAVNLLKPPGMSSYAAVAAVKRITGVKKVGHCGTLDPGAAGVLPVLLGKATRLSQYLTEKDKCYRAEITLGWTSDSGDAFGWMQESGSAAHIDKTTINAVLAGFCGEIKQIPPMTSAIKVNGKKLYELARDGLEIERAARSVTIYSLNLIDFLEAGTAHPRLLLDICCSKGTYIRTLAQDIGQALGVGAYMSFLLRTRSGQFTSHQAATLEEIESYWQQGIITELIIAPQQLLTGLPTVTVNDAGKMPVSHGNRLNGYSQTDQGFSLTDLPTTVLLLQDSQQNLLALATVKSEAEQVYLQPIIVMI